MVCSNCKQEGHTKATCSQSKAAKVDKPKVKVGRPAKVETTLEPAEPPVPITLVSDVREKLNKLTGYCVEVATGLGKGHVEGTYQEALCFELQEACISYTSEEPMPIYYRGRPLGGGHTMRLDVVLRNFLPFIYELKAVSKICPEHHWQLVRYMTYKRYEYGAVVNFNQSDKGPLEIQLIVANESGHWLYDPVTETGRRLIDYGLSLAPTPTVSNIPGSSNSSANSSANSSDTSSVSTVAEDWEWPQEC